MKINQITGLTESQADYHISAKRAFGLITYCILELDGTYTVKFREPTAAEVRRGY